MADHNTEMVERIAIVGDGSMATVCGLLLESKGFSVRMWGPHPEHVDSLIQTRENNRYLPGHKLPATIEIHADPEAALQGVDLVVSAIPTQFIREAWRRLGPHAPAGVPIASVAKGIEKETLLRPTQIIQATLAEAEAPAADAPVAALSGPTVAAELARCLPATVLVASGDREVAASIQTTFSTRWFRAYTHSDLLGVELAGATKNVIALAAGILDGLQAGNNAKSALLARGLAEITRLGRALGADTATFYGLAGVGDLATTCFSPTGRNRTCGEELGRGRPLDQVLENIAGIVEGVPTTAAVLGLAERYDVEMPITRTVNRVLFEGLDPIEGIDHLMSRELKPERIE